MTQTTFTVVVQWVKAGRLASLGLSVAGWRNWGENYRDAARLGLAWFQPRRGSGDRLGLAVGLARDFLGAACTFDGQSEPWLVHNPAAPGVGVGSAWTGVGGM